jgi:hypothetical protein
MSDDESKVIKGIKVFISYAHEDDSLRVELDKHLSLLKSQKLIDVWHDRDISAGTEWEQTIDRHLNTAQIILLLVSPDFMASSYCYSIEMKRAMERHEAGDARVIPVILRPVLWKSAAFGKLQALPTNAEPVTSRHWHTRDEAFFAIAQGIQKALEELMPAVSELQTRTSIVQENSILSPSSIGHSNAVLFDEAHGQSLWTLSGMPPTIDDGYKLIKELTQQHYTVEVLKEKEVVTATKLHKYATFVLPIGPGRGNGEGFCYLKDEEVDALRDYVSQGGGLLVLGYYTGDWHHEANLNKVLKRYGITFNNDVVMPKNADAVSASNQMYEGRLNSKDLVVAQPSADGSDTDRMRIELRRELLTEVNKIATLSSCSLHIDLAATAILSSGSESTLFEPEPLGQGVRIKSYMETGNGPAVLVGASVNHRVIAVGSWKTFLNEFIDDTNYDNRRLYENVLSWLTTKR